MEEACGRWVSGRPGAKEEDKEEGEVEEEEEEGRCCRYWALTRVSLREGLSFGQRARSKCA